MDIKLIQWFGNNDIESFSAMCINLCRIMSASKIPFETVTFDVPKSGKMLEHRLSDVPVLKVGDRMIKGYAQCIQYLIDEKLISRFLPDNKAELANCRVLHEWSMMNFFPISTYYSYHDDRNYKRLKSLMNKSKVFSGSSPESDDNKVKEFLKSQLTTNLHMHPIFSMNESDAENFLFSHIQMILDIMANKRFLLSNDLSLADITTFSTLVRLFYGAPDVLAASRSSFIQLFKWMERVDQLTTGPNTISPFCLQP